MKVSLIALFFVSWFYTHGQTDEQFKQLLSSYPMKEKSDYIKSKIWLAAKSWEDITDEFQRPVFLSKSDAKGATIHLIPVFYPRKEIIKEFDSTKSILHYLAADPDYRYLAIVCKKVKPVCLLDASHEKQNGKGGLIITVENFLENKHEVHFLKRFADASTIYFDEVFQMFCSVENGKVAIYYPYERKWIPFNEFISGRLSAYKEAAR